MTTTEYDAVEKHRSQPNGGAGEVDKAGVAEKLEETTLTEGGEIVGAKEKGYPDFGHNMLKYWKMRPGCGSVFTTPQACY